MTLLSLLHNVFKLTNIETTTDKQVGTGGKHTLRIARCEQMTRPCCILAFQIFLVFAAADYALWHRTRSRKPPLEITADTVYRVQSNRLPTVQV